MEQQKTALLVIDVQQGFDEPVWGTRNNPDAEANIALLLAQWRAVAYPVIHIQHCSIEPQSPLNPQHPGNAFKPEAQPLPGEPVFTKTVNSAFIGTDLAQYLGERGVSHLVIVGLTTDHCVSTTTRMAGNLGFQVMLLADATATFNRTSYDGSTMFSAEEIHAIHLSSLQGEFCTVTNTAKIIQSCLANEWST